MSSDTHLESPWSKWWRWMWNGLPQFASDQLPIKFATVFRLLSRNCSESLSRLPACCSLLASRKVNRFRIINQHSVPKSDVTWMCDYSFRHSGTACDQVARIARLLGRADFWKQSRRRMRSQNSKALLGLTKQSTSAQPVLSARAV